MYRIINESSVEMTTLQRGEILDLPQNIEVTNGNDIVTKSSNNLNADMTRLSTPKPVMHLSSSTEVCEVCTY